MNDDDDLRTMIHVRLVNLGNKLKQHKVFKKN